MGPIVIYGPSDNVEYDEDLGKQTICSESKSKLTRLP